MSYNTTMHANFESEKNKKAFLYTLIICGTILLLAFLITFPILKVTLPIAQDLMEINLGNNEEGFGEKQPLIKGAMSPVAAPEPQPVKASAPSPPAENEAKPEDNAEEDAAAVTKSTKAVVKKTAVNPNIKPVAVYKNPAPAPVSVPKPPKPVATYKGPGNGKGNGATEDNGYRYQGTKPGGKGDAGDPSGKPDSYGNTPGGKSGVSVLRGSRPLNLGSLKFEDDFNQNAKVYLDVKYNSAGTFISSAVAKGTTTSNNTILSIAKRKAGSLKFPATEDGGVSTIIFNFRIN